MTHNGFRVNALPYQTNAPRNGKYRVSLRIPDDRYEVHTEGGEIHSINALDVSIAKAGDNEYAGVDHYTAVMQLTAFIAEAEVALEALKRKENYGGYGEFGHPEDE